MKIRSKLLINTGLSVGLVTLIGVVLLFTARYVGEISERGRIANDIVKGVFELTLISDEYLLNKQPRAIRQWNLRYVSLGELLSSLSYKEPAAQAVLGRIIQEHKGIKNTFESLIKNHTNLEQLRKSRTILLERKNAVRNLRVKRQLLKQLEKKSGIYKKLDERVVSQLLSKSQAMVSGGLQLSESSKAEIKSTETIAAITVMGFVLGLGFINMIASLLITRSVVDPIKHVTDAAKKISAGDMEQRIGHHSNDEIGILSRTFDEMMDNLSTTTASRDELNLMNKKLKDSTSQLIQFEKMASIRAKRS